MNRREACRLIAALAVAGPTVAAEGNEMIAREIPSSGERVPVIGMGSSGTFDVAGAPAETSPLRDVLLAFADGGGRVIDTSPMYGRAESVLGDLIAELGLRPKLWLATKVWTRGRQAGAQQIAESMRRLRTERLELLQIHNLLDWREHVPTLKTLQQSGKLRYTGITHYRADAHVELERVLREERFDWLQVNYSLAERSAETRLLPFCRDHGIAVMVNRPFADGGMFRRVQGKPLPPWARELGCATWAQFFLKFVASHPAVTCTIPATARASHVRDNCAAGSDPMPDAGQRSRMADYWDGLQAASPLSR
jgi:aryl-alcohol dehydrogenase-like predicted oxidoreductase